MRLDEFIRQLQQLQQLLVAKNLDPRVGWEDHEYGTFREVESIRPKDAITEDEHGQRDEFCVVFDEN